MQNVEPPEATSPEAQAVQGGRPSELKEFDGHLPGRGRRKDGSVGGLLGMSYNREGLPILVLKIQKKTSRFSSPLVHIHGFA